jgi:rRNA biogenesis protein RRP5
VLIKDLADDFVNNPAEVFPPGRLVRGRVTTITEDPVHGTTVQVSLRSSDVDGDKKLSELANLSTGQIVSGTVHKVADFGVFVSIDGSSVIGLSRTVDAANKDESLFEQFSKGDAVRARVLKISGQKVSLGLKERYFREDYDAVEEKEEIDEASEASEVQDEDDDSEGVMELLSEADDSDDEEMEALIRKAQMMSDDVYEDDGEEDEDEVPLEKVVSRKRSATSTLTKTEAAVKKSKTAVPVVSSAPVLQWDDFQPVKKTNTVSSRLCDLYSCAL